MRTEYTSWAALEGASHKVQMTTARARFSFSDCLFTLYSAVAVLGTYAHRNPEDKCSRSCICSSLYRNNVQ